jgi:hypothetical protein
MLPYRNLSHQDEKEKGEKANEVPLGIYEWVDDHRLFTHVIPQLRAGFVICVGCCGH